MTPGYPTPQEFGQFAYEMAQAHALGKYIETASAQGMLQAPLLGKLLQDDTATLLAEVATRLAIDLGELPVPETGGAFKLAATAVQGAYTWLSKGSWKLLEFGSKNKAFVAVLGGIGIAGYGIHAWLALPEQTKLAAVQANQAVALALAENLPPELALKAFFKTQESLDQAANPSSVTKTLLMAAGIAGAVWLVSKLIDSRQTSPRLEGESA